MASTHAQEGGRFLQTGQTQDAVKSFQKGLSIDPNDVDCLLGLVRVHLSTGAAADAEAAVLRLLKAKPDHTEGQAHLAMLRAQAGNPEALESLKALAAAPTAGYFERFNLGSLLFERGDLAGARAAFESVLQVSPGSTHVHFELGRIRLQQNEPDGAVSHFLRAAEGAPQEAMPLLMLSRAHAACGQLGLAIQAATQALEKARGGLHRAVLEDLFKLYLSAGSSEGAKRAALELRKLDPSSTTYLYLHGLATMSAGAFAEAKDVFAEVLRQAPGSWQAQHALAQMHLALGERAEAVTLLEAAVATVPTDPGPTNDLAVVLMQDNGHARVAALLAPVLGAHPNDAGTHLNMALGTFPSDKELSARHAKQALALGAEDVRAQAEQLLKQLGA
ncbi:tetratricopeptide repeat protein [Myxococcus sp. AM001]|uniref:tetratricopeptide repeat protein n=1 Tax=Myxococcus vastator TaxID=2709664 RepID=UPI0013CF9D58|nr:tetratricopeptide repeat protein [Myxococcus vastator]NVJ08500.1 tetratricopeptide repeat protein [Myxococcus sp. AM001]